MRIPVFIVLLFWTLFTPPRASAQTGLIGTGAVLFPDGAGMSIKTFLDQNLALNFNLNYGGAFFLRNKSASSSLLIEYHFFLPNPGLRLFFGGGPFVGYWPDPEKNPPTSLLLGVCGSGGFEYFLKKAPVSMFIVARPKLSYLYDSKLYLHSALGFGAHYWISKRKPTSPGGRQR